MIENFDVESSYTGDGLTTELPFDFLITRLEDLKLIILDDAGDLVLEDDGNDTTYIDSVEYDSVEGGGTITLLVALPTDYEAILQLNVVDPTQESMFRDRTEYTFRNVEKKFDYVITCIQSLFFNMRKSVKLPAWISHEDFDTTLPADLADNPGANLQVNATGDGFSLSDSDDTGPTITGTRAVPQAIVAATGIEFVGTNWYTHWWVVGSGGADANISSNPQIAEATNAGQRLKLTGTSDAARVILEDGNGLITGGQTLSLGENSVVIFEADQDLNWVLESTNGLV